MLLWQSLEKISWETSTFTSWHRRVFWNVWNWLLGWVILEVYGIRRCVPYTSWPFYGFLGVRLGLLHPAFPVPFCGVLWVLLIWCQFFCKALIRGGVRLSRLVKHLTIRHRRLKSFCKVCSLNPVSIIRLTATCLWEVLIDFFASRHRLQ